MISVIHVGNDELFRERHRLSKGCMEGGPVQKDSEVSDDRGSGDGGSWGRGVQVGLVILAVLFALRFLGPLVMGAGILLRYGVIILGLGLGVYWLSGRLFGRARRRAGLDGEQRRIEAVTKEGIREKILECSTDRIDEARMAAVGEIVDECVFSGEESCSEFMGVLEGALAEIRKKVPADHVLFDREIAALEVRIESMKESVAKLHAHANEWLSGQEDVRYSTVNLLIGRLRDETGKIAEAGGKIQELLEKVDGGIDKVLVEEDRVRIDLEFGDVESEARDIVLAEFNEDVERLKMELDSFVEAVEDTYARFSK